jgi:hypothetical protein
VQQVMIDLLKQPFPTLMRELVLRVIIEVQRAWSGSDTAILSQSTAREMLSPQSGGSVGIGFWVEEGHSVRFFHGGDNEGFKCLLTGDVDKGTGIVIMTNGQRA